MLNVIATAPASRELRVAMIPDYRSGNPYQRLISEGLEKLRVHVSFSQEHGRLFLLLAAARRADVDVVHLHWISPFLPDVAVPIYLLYATRLLLDIVLTRVSGVRVVWTIHNKVSHEARYPRLEMGVRRAISNLVDAMIVHSPESRREVAAALAKAPTKFDVVPHLSFDNVYGESPGVEQSREALGLGQSGRVFLNFGLMRPYKGLKRLLEAWHASGLGRDGHLLLLAGEFIDRSFSHEIVSSANSIAGVRVDAGFVPNDRVRLYFGACDAVVCPFERVLTSGSLHLAITFEKPIVAPRMASVGDVLGAANPFAYDPADPNGLSDALRDCAVSNLATQRREIASIRASLLDSDEVARATLAVYERVCRGSERLRSPARFFKMR